MNPIVSNVLVLTLWSFIVSMVGIMAVGLIEGKSAFRPIHAISHMFFGDETYSVDRFHPKFFFIGTGLNLAAMVGWAAILELGFRFLRVTPTQPALTIAGAVGVTVLAYIVDFIVVPKRLTPGFEHVVSFRSLIAVYVLLAVSLAIGGLMRA